MRLGTAAVWIVFGLAFKVLHLLPRHETIVAAVIGQAWAAPLTVAIGVAETLIGLWILTGRWPLACAAVQTGAIVTMNLCELLLAREHLLSPIGMVGLNLVFLSLVWFIAVRTPPRT